jgi:hypothetical protein
MRITKKQALSLIARLSRTGQYPSDAGELARSADALIEAARGDTVKAEQIVEAIRKSAEFFPPDAAFFRTAEALRDSTVPTWNPKQVFDCEACGDTRYIHTTINGYECSDPCPLCAAKRMPPVGEAGDRKTVAGGDR